MKINEVRQKGERERETEGAITQNGKQRQITRKRRKR